MTDEQYTKRLREELQALGKTGNSRAGDGLAVRTRVNAERDQEAARAAEEGANADR